MLKKVILNSRISIIIVDTFLIMRTSFDQKGEINMNHIPLKITRRLSVIFTILGLLVLSIGICIGPMIGFIVIVAGLLILVGTIIFVAVFARCPYCGGFMKVGFHNYHCPHCGKYVNYNDS